MASAVARPAFADRRLRIALLDGKFHGPRPTPFGNSMATSADPNSVVNLDMESALELAKSSLCP